MPQICLCGCPKLVFPFEVSTWFANARRRLKKENKMTWSPRNRGNEDEDGDEEGEGRDGGEGEGEGTSGSVSPEGEGDEGLKSERPKKRIWSIEDTLANGPCEKKAKVEIKVGKFRKL